MNGSLVNWRATHQFTINRISIIMNKTWLFSLALCLTLSAGAFAQTPAQQKVDNTAADVGNATEKGTRATGRAAVKAGKAVGKAGKATGKAVGNAAKATGRGVSKAAKKTKDAVTPDNR